MFRFECFSICGMWKVFCNTVNDGVASRCGELFAQAQQLFSSHRKWMKRPLRTSPRAVIGLAMIGIHLFAVFCNPHHINFSHAVFIDT